MALYEISEQQVNVLKILINSANIKGADALIILTLLQILDKPIKKEDSNGK